MITGYGYLVAKESGQYWGNELPWWRNVLSECSCACGMGASYQHARSNIFSVLWSAYPHIMRYELALFFCQSACVIHIALFEVHYGRGSSLFVSVVSALM